VKSWPEDVQKDCRFVLGNSLEQGVERLQALVEAWRWGKGLLAARYPAMIPKSVSASSAVEHENKGESMATKRDEQAADYRAEAIARPFAEAAERSSTVSEKGEGQSGMRTERITLEVTHDLDARLSDWIVEVVDESLGLMESVCVVSEEERDARTSTPGEVSCAAPAASGNSSAQPNGSRAASGLEQQGVSYGTLSAPAGDSGQGSRTGGGEPVAWGVIVGGKIDQHAGSDALFVDNEEAQEWCHDAAISNRGTVVPLYRAPPQPRGWLTEEEREAVEWFSRLDCQQYNAYCQHCAGVAKSLLARSSPPEVVLPRVYCHGGDGEPLVDLEDVRAALAAAGVAVKLPPGPEGEA